MLVVTSAGNQGLIGEEIGARNAWNGPGQIVPNVLSQIVLRDKLRVIVQGVQQRIHVVFIFLADAWWQHRVRRDTGCLGTACARCMRGCSEIEDARH